MVERIPLLCRTAELPSASGRTLEPPEGPGGSGPLAVTAGRTGVGKKVSQREREVTTQTATRRQGAGAASAFEVSMINVSCNSH